MDLWGSDSPKFLFGFIAFVETEWKDFFFLVGPKGCD